jgi:hypothetical protein
MIDIIGGISLTALFGLCAAFLITAIPVDTATRWRMATAAVIWFACIGCFAALGGFSANTIGTMAMGMTILTPIALFVFAASRWPKVRNAALQTSLAVLVAIHTGRILGVFFLFLLEAGRLPPTFALTAGWGDIGVALAALPLAWAIQHQVAGWRVLTLVWNLFGFADLVTAVTLGVGSAPDSPARFIFESPNSGAVATLPWVLIPALLVPLYLMTHLAIFAQLARSIAEKRHTRQGKGLAYGSRAV